MADSQPTATSTPSWMNPSPCEFNAVLSTPEKQKRSRRTGNLKGRAKRGTLGSFAGLRPPKSPTKLAAFEKKKAMHYEQKAAARLQAQSGVSHPRQRRQREPMRVESMQPKVRTPNPWYEFMAKELPTMQGGDFKTKMVELSKKWKNMKMKDNHRVGPKPSTSLSTSES